MLNNMILTWQGVCDHLGYEKKSDLAPLITIAKNFGIGKSISFQKTEYSENDFVFLDKILQAWQIICQHSLNGLVDCDSRKKMQLIIVNSLIKGELHFFSIFCPSYKKGLGSFGYNKVIGENTKKAISDIVLFLDDFKKIGINFDFNLYFSDLLLENYSKLVGTEYRNDLKENYNNFKKTIEAGDYGDILKCHLLSDEKYLLDNIGEKGMDCYYESVPPNIFNQVYERNLVFYKEKLGWNESDVLFRTKVLACCYDIMGKYFIKKFSNLAVMFWVESAYERGKLYSGMNQDDPMPIIYPKNN